MLPEVSEVAGATEKTRGAKNVRASETIRINDSALNLSTCNLRNQPLSFSAASFACWKGYCGCYHVRAGSDLGWRTF